WLVRRVARQNRPPVNGRVSACVKLDGLLDVGAADCQIGRFGVSTCQGLRLIRKPLGRFRRSADKTTRTRRLLCTGLCPPVRHTRPRGPERKPLTSGNENERTGCHHDGTEEPHPAQG